MIPNVLQIHSGYLSFLADCIQEYRYSYGKNEISHNRDAYKVNHKWHVSVIYQKTPYQKPFNKFFITLY